MLLKLSYKRVSLTKACLFHSVCLCFYSYQECNWRGLARDHVIMSESQTLWRAVRDPWEGVWQRLCLLLLCLLYLPLLLSGQFWYTPRSQCNCWPIIHTIRCDCCVRLASQKSMDFWHRKWYTWAQHSKVNPNGVGSFETLWQHPLLICVLFKLANPLLAS